MKDAPPVTLAENGPMRQQSWADAPTPAASIRRRPRRHRVYLCGDVEVDVDERIVRVRGQRVAPTYGEFELLLRLIQDPGRVVTRSELQLNPATPNPRAVDVQIRRLRVRLARARHFVVETVPRVGYRCRKR